ncbi:MAG: hypothetical protein ACKO3C_02690, partial [Betaproteobacteria bacterium]
AAIPGVHFAQWRTKLFSASVSSPPQKVVQARTEKFGLFFGLQRPIPLQRSIAMQHSIPLQRSIAMQHSVPLQRSIALQRSIPLHRSIALRHSIAFLPTFKRDRLRGVLRATAGVASVR